MAKLPYYSARNNYLFLQAGEIMKSIKQVEDKTIIGIPNNIFKYNAGGFQLIKLEEIQTIWPFTVH